MKKQSWSELIARKYPGKVGQETCIYTVVFHKDDPPGIILTKWGEIIYLSSRYYSTRVAHFDNYFHAYAFAIKAAKALNATLKNRVIKG